MSFFSKSNNKKSSGITPKAEQDELDSGIAANIIAGRMDPDEPIECGSIDLSGLNLPADRIPKNLKCRELRVKACAFTQIPETWRITSKLDLSHHGGIRELPRGLRVNTLVLNGCTSLESLPEDMHVHFLIAPGCTSLVNWPDSARVENGSVDIERAVRLKRLPPLGPLSSLSIRGCELISELEEGTIVNSWLDLAGTQIKSLPVSLNDVQLRWQGVNVSEQIVFRPETLDINTVLQDSNIERRRVAIDRIGREKLISRPDVATLDKDTDAGGERRLLQIPLRGDEPLTLVSVRCPSTGRQYLIRVPPTVRTCRQAVAWTAGFDNPDDYNPVLET